MQNPAEATCPLEGFRLRNCAGLCKHKGLRAGLAPPDLVVCIEEQQRGGEHGIALGDEVQRRVLPKVGWGVCLHAAQLHVQQHLQ